MNHPTETATKYICLGYIEERTWEHPSESERNAMMDECLAYDDELRRNGHFGAELTPELREQEERLRTRIEEQRGRT